MDALIPAPPKHQPDLRVPQRHHTTRGLVVPYYAPAGEPLYGGSAAAQALMASQWVPRAAGVLRGYPTPASMHTTPQPRKPQYGLYGQPSIEDAAAIVDVFMQVNGGGGQSALRKLREMDKRHEEMRRYCKSELEDMKSRLITVIQQWDLFQAAQQEMAQVLDFRQMSNAIDANRKTRTKLEGELGRSHDSNRAIVTEMEKIHQGSARVSGGGWGGMVLWTAL